MEDCQNYLIKYIKSTTYHFMKDCFIFKNYSNLVNSKKSNQKISDEDLSNYIIDNIHSIIDCIEKKQGFIFFSKKYCLDHIFSSNSKYYNSTRVTVHFKNNKMIIEFQESGKKDALLIIEPFGNNQIKYVIIHDFDINKYKSKLDNEKTTPKEISYSKYVKQINVPPNKIINQTNPNFGKDYQCIPNRIDIKNKNQNDSNKIRRIYNNNYNQCHGDKYSNNKQITPKYSNNSSRIIQKEYQKCIEKIESSEDRKELNKTVEHEKFESKNPEETFRSNRNLNQRKNNIYLKSNQKGEESSRINTGNIRKNSIKEKVFYEKNDKFCPQNQVKLKDNEQKKEVKNKDRPTETNKKIESQNNAPEKEININDNESNFKNEMKKEIEKDPFEIQKYKDILKDKDNEINKIEKEKDIICKENDSNKKIIKEKDSKIQELNIKVGQINQIEKENKTLKEKINNLIIEKKDIENNNEKQKNLINDYKKEIENLKNKINEGSQKEKNFQESNNKLINENKEMKENISEINKEMEGKEKTIQDLKNKLKENENKNLECQKKIKEMENMNKNYEKEIWKLKNDLNKEKEEERKIMGNYNKLKLENENSDKEIINLKKKCSDIENELKDKNVKNEGELEKEKNKMNEILKEKDKIIEDLNKKNNKIQLELDNSNKKFKLEEEKNEKNMKINNSKNENLNKELKELKDNYALISNENKDLKDQLEAKNKQINEIDNKNQKDEVDKSNIKTKDNEIEKLKLQINDLLQIEKALKEKEKQNFELNNKYNSLLDNHNNLSQENEKLKKEIQKLTEGIPPVFLKPTLIGLNNIGATCFMNATLQCLSQTKQLTDFFLIKKHRDLIINNNIAKENKKDLQLSPLYLELIENLWNPNSNKPYSPFDFRKIVEKMNPLFAQNQPGDSKDFIYFILQQLHKELCQFKLNYDENFQVNQYDQISSFKNCLNEFYKHGVSIISDTFYFFTEKQTICMNCANMCNQQGFNCPILYNHQIDILLNFPLEEVRKFVIGQQVPNNNNQINNTLTLIDCFNYYGKVDFFTGDNQNYCNSCQQLSDAQSITSIHSNPNVLIIILNRGKNNIYKIDLDFPQTLDLSQFVKYKDKLLLLYDLYGVITHLGQSGPNAHFVASCKSPIDSKWYRYNDGSVTPIGDFQKDVLKFGTPYILFYKKI